MYMENASTRFVRGLGRLREGIPREVAVVLVAARPIIPHKACSYATVDSLVCIPSVYGKPREAVCKHYRRHFEAGTNMNKIVISIQMSANYHLDLPHMTKKLMAF